MHANTSRIILLPLDCFLMEVCCFPSASSSLITDIKNDEKIENDELRAELEKKRR
jgi:hypothetical protein